jgi:hypothetical protein
LWEAQFRTILAIDLAFLYPCRMGRSSVKQACGLTLCPIVELIHGPALAVMASNGQVPMDAQVYWLSVKLIFFA